MTLAVRLKDNLGSANTDRNPSPGIWGDCPILSILEGTIAGVMMIDDFDQGGLITSPTTTAALVGKSFSGFGSSGSAITYSDELGGGVKLAETTDDEGVSIFSLSHCFQMGLTKGPLWFEARIKPSHTATTEQAMFLGLADSTAKSITIPLIAAVGAMADMNYVGFHKLETDLTSIKTVYRADGVTAVTVETCTSALEATVYVKLGFRLDESGELTFFINNQPQADTYQLLDDLGTSFPSDITMAPILAMILGAGANDNTLIMDWWRCVQLC